VLRGLSRKRPARRVPRARSRKARRHARCFGRGAKFSVARAAQTEGAPQPCAAVRPAANSSRTWHALRASTCTQAQLQARHRCCSFVCGTRKVLETRRVMICKERASVVPSCVVMKHFDGYNSAAARGDGATAPAPEWAPMKKLDGKKSKGPTRTVWQEYIYIPSPTFGQPRYGHMPSN
jgi:hypothetical protein